MSRHSICFVLNHPSDKLGGSELQARIIAEELARKGWKTTFVSPKPNSKSKHVKDINKVEIKYVTNKLRPWTIGKIIKQLRQVNADMYYTRSKPMYGAITALYSIIYNKKITWHCAIEGECYYFGNVIRELENNKIHPYYLLRAVIQDICLLVTRLVASNVICQAQYQKKQMANRFGLTCSVVPNIHYTEDYNISNHKQQEVLWVANIGPKKRLHKFIDVAEIYGRDQLKFTVVGGVTNEAYYRNISRRLKHNKQINHVGQIDFREAQRFFERTKYFINTSREEGFPNTIIQAWMAGCVVITLNLDPDKLLSQHELGFCCNSTTEIACTIESLEQNDEKRGSVQARARKYAANKHSVKENIPILERILSR